MTGYKRLRLMAADGLAELILAVNQAHVEV